MAQRIFTNHLQFNVDKYHSTQVELKKLNLLLNADLCLDDPEIKRVEKRITTAQQCRLSGILSTAVTLGIHKRLCEALGISK